MEPDTVRRWRARFAQKGIGGIGVVAKSCGLKPGLPEGWSPRSSECVYGQDEVARIRIEAALALTTAAE